MTWTQTEAAPGREPRPRGGCSLTRHHPSCKEEAAARKRPRGTGQDGAAATAPHGEDPPVPPLQGRRRQHLRHPPGGKQRDQDRALPLPPPAQPRRHLVGPHGRAGDAIGRCPLPRGDGGGGGGRAVAAAAGRRDLPAGGGPRRGHSGRAGPGRAAIKLTWLQARPRLFLTHGGPGVALGGLWGWLWGCWGGARGS